ncbi:alcohol dehydrogenase catalytic domain-containing protein [Gracilibacillus sp. YIM 98692]|uniref:zinc-binding dehydrogenase n=1 Tax=Gracilibacillus sp. YIM 98692 TaxID=2663532 RepID=UPI001969BFBD|nr:alcohol dehydrogenase catalytic domain-containing protein [Gracilibacillus sp. YIM 98692]
MEKLKDLPKTMHAVVCHGPEDYRYEQVDVPEINEDEVLVRIKACGICASDIKSYQGAAMFWGGGVLPPWNDAPVNAGHEFIGEVVAIGDKAKIRHNLEIGDLAIAEQIVPCRECRYCIDGTYWMCENQNIYGHQRIVADGGMAEYMKYHSNSIVHKVPKTIPEKHAATIEPLSCSVHTIERANIEFDDVVVVAGLGPIGLMKLQLAKLKSPKLLIGIDLKPKRLDLAKKLGADIVLNPAEQDVEAEVKKLTDGYGCDVYIHNSGHPSGVIQGLKMIRKRGTFVEFSVFSDETSVDWSIIGDRKELNVVGSHISGQDGYPVAIKMLEKGLVKVDEIITHEFRLEDFMEAFRLAEKGDDSIKTILVP